MKKSATRYFWDIHCGDVCIHRPYKMVQNVNHYRDNTFTKTSLTLEFWEPRHCEITYHQYIMWLAFEETPTTFI